jgi:DNA-binding CsgD family transcriptional regulator
MPEATAPVPGTEFRYGDHLCAVYVGSQQRDDVLLPFLRAGLLAGNKCVAVVDDATPEDALNVLRPGVDLTEYLHSNQLLLRTSADTYLRDGRFEAQRTLDFWSGIADAAERFPFGCAVAEVPASVHAAGELDAFMSYESDLNSFLDGHPRLALMCLYDLALHSAHLPHLLRTHPKVVLGGQPLDNPHYLIPEQYRDWRRNSAVVSTGWPGLTAQEQRISRLIATGLTNRQIGEQLGVSGHTVDSHVKHVFAKLDVTSRVRLTRIVLAEEPGAAERRAPEGRQGTH